MNTAGGYCCCCYSFEELETLYGPALNVFTLFRNTQGLINEDTQIATCLRCCEFLKKVDWFRTSHGTDENSCDYLEHIDVKNYGYKKSSQVDNKTKVIDKCKDINGIDVQINKVDVDSDPKNSQEISETLSDVSTYADTNKDNFLIELHGKESPRDKQNTETLEHRMIAHQILHSKRRLIIMIDRCDGIIQTLNGRKLVSSNIKSLSINYDKPSKMFSCDQCSYSTSLKTSFNKHKKIHWDNCDEPHKCGKCSFQTTNLFQLQLHTRHKHRDENPFRCNQCNYCTRKKKDLLFHIRTHLEDYEKPYKCNECSFNTTTSFQLKCHISRKHNDDKPFKCDQCNYCAKMKKDLNFHKRKHTDDYHNSYKCTECPFKTTSSFQLKYHVMRTHDAKSFLCDQCNYVTEIKKHLIIHIGCHSKDQEKPHKCSECSYKTSTLYRLKIHTKRRHSDDKPFSCDQCDYRSKVVRSLNVHKRTHLSDCDNPYKCSKCSFKAVSQYHLRLHDKRKHSDEKPFECDQCNFRCKLAYNLNYHKKIHMKDCDKPFKCSECSFATIKLSRLNDHVTHKHNDDKPFSCDECKYSAKVKRDLTRHKLTHLNDCDKPSKCTECSYQTVRMRELKNHIKRKHANTKPFTQTANEN